MTETGEAAVGGLQGDKLYQIRARAALSILVRQAKANQTMLYCELAEELGMPNPRNLNYVLGAIGNSILQLMGEWGVKIPPIQALVVNKSTHLPGVGLSWFVPDACQFKSASLRGRKIIVDALLSEVFTFRRWDDVLRSFGLKPLPPPSVSLPSVKDVIASGGIGEGDSHKQLKISIASHPEWLGLPSMFAPGEIEVALYSGDRVDVVFANKEKRIAVEVKPQGASFEDIVRGIFQYIKYAAVIDAEERASETGRDCSAILALGGALPTELLALCRILGVDFRDRLEAGGAMAS